MKRFFLVCVLLLIFGASDRLLAAEPYAWGKNAWQNGLPNQWVTTPYCDPWIDYGCAAPPQRKTKPGQPCDPYLDYSCLDTYLGDDFATRLYRYYVLELGKGMAPADPKAPPSTRPPNGPNALGAAVLPESNPPAPYIAYPYGGTQNIGATIPNGIDSPLMVALGNTSVGKWLNDAHVQIYGWVDPAGNISSDHVKPNGNAPAAYDYTPNTVQLDQAVLYIERVPDEVQNDHFDWGFRVSGIYGVDYRYTFAYGWFGPNQLIEKNQINGFDDPMMYVDLYWPVLQGMNVRIGRFISVPDIEAQLAPNNYSYVHSLTYSWDNYTNTGIEFTTALTRNWILQTGFTVGTEAPFWHWGEHIQNQYVIQGMTGAGFGAGVDPLFPGKSMLKDPGVMPSVTLGVKWTSDDGADDFNIIADAWNDGTWGYNNLQWVGFTYYHKLNDYWHIAMDTYNIHVRNVPDLNNPSANVLLFGSAAGPNNGALGFGTPFSTAMNPFSTVNAAWCMGPQNFNNRAVAGAPLTCTTDTQTFLIYVNYSPDKLNNFSFRTEYFNDPQGQRTGTPTAYAEAGVSWQHWFSPQIEVRPEVAYYRSIDNPAFNNQTKNWAAIAATDLIFHF
jgi:hypothetical protein